MLIQRMFITAGHRTLIPQKQKVGMESGAIQTVTVALKSPNFGLGWMGLNGKKLPLGVPILPTIQVLLTGKMPILILPVKMLLRQHWMQTCLIH